MTHRKTRTRKTRLQVESLEARDNPSLVLLSDDSLAELRQSAAANTAQWQAFKTKLDQGLPQILSRGDYQGGSLGAIADYSLGYQVLKVSDPATASKYADKALAILKSGLRDLQKIDWMTRQLLTRGDGTTKTFTLPHTDIVPTSLRVYLGNVWTKAIVHGSANSADLADWYSFYLKVSNTSDGSPSYTEGSDWLHNSMLRNNFIDWSPGGSEPSPGSTYYLTMTTPYGVPAVAATLSGNTIALTTAPRTDQAVFVEYVYGANAPSGSGLAFQQTSSGDGGFNSIYIDDTYTSRYLGKFVALGFDWLSDYAGYSSALKAETAGLLTKWSDYVRDFGYFNNAPASNYGAGGYVSRMLTALALSNQGNANGPRLVGEMNAYRQNYLIPTLQNNDASLKGGFWAEGWNYGQMAARNVLIAGLAFEGAGLGTASVERQWATEVIHHLIEGQPTRSSVYDAGDWYTYPTPLPNKDLFYLLAETTNDSNARAYANYIIQNYPGAQTSDFQDLLYRDSSAATAEWPSMPLQYRAQGTGLVTARADWSYNSTWLSFQLGNTVGADHQSYSPGQLQLNRGSDAMLINATSALQYTDIKSKTGYSNLVTIDDNGEGYLNYRYNMGFWYGSPGVITTAYQVTDDLVYIAGDYKAAYSKNDNPGGGGPATQLTRQVVYLRPDFAIVHDRAGTVKDYFPKELRWHHLTAPTISGNKWVDSVGSSKLFGATFSGQPITTVTAPVTYNGKTVHRVTTKNANPSANVRYTTAFQTAPSTTTSMVATVRVASGDGRMEGVQMGGYVVLFGTDGTVDLAAGTVGYNFNGTNAVKHLLTDLTPGGAYQIKVDGVVLGTFTASSQGTITFDTAAGASSVLVLAGTAGPAANPDSYSVLHDRSLPISAADGVLKNDSSPSGAPLTAILVNGPSHGTLEFNSNGSFTYIPTAHYAGSDSFTYKVSDGVATSTAATVTLTVTNTAPSSTADSYTVSANRATTIAVANGVLSNDTDADSDAITAVLVANPTHGTVQLNADGSFTYTAGDYDGVDTFTYRASDGVTTGALTTVTIDVQGTTPVAQPDSYDVLHDRILAIGAVDGVLKNDDSPLGNELSAVLVTGPSHGTLEFNANGSFTYTPNTHYVGSDSFTYRATDGTYTSAAATVTLNVKNTAPSSSADTYAVKFNSETTVSAASGVLANDTDADGDSLTAILVGNPSHGTVQFNADGSFTYVVNGYFGTDTFSYRASDGVTEGPLTTVTITVETPGPIANPDAYKIRHDRSLSVGALVGVLANDLSPTGLPLKSLIVDRPAHGTVTLYKNGSFVYKPGRKFSGQDTFTYRAFDGVAYSDPTTVTITVEDSAPLAGADSYKVAGDSTFSVSSTSGLLANDSDADKDPMTVVVETQPTHGTLVMATNGAFRYVPHKGYVGPDSFSYHTKTSTFASETANVNLDVLARPKVESVVINDSDAQRSRITSVTVTFDRLVTLDPRAVFVLRSDGLKPGQQWQVIEENGKTKVIITFSGAGTEGGSLRDGKWLVKVLPGRVHRADHLANRMVAPHVTRFHRFFGDVDGNRTVDDVDQIAFNAALGQTDAASLATFDSDGDGDVDTTDQMAFSKRFGRRI